MRKVPSIVKLPLSFILGLAMGPEMAGAHELVTRTIEDRTYLAYLPEDYSSRTEPMQVLLALHPATFDGAWFQNQARLEEQAAAEDLIIIYPNGSEGLLSGLSWDAADPRGIDRGDTDFLFAALSDIATLAPTKEKFALTGFSAGALMIYRLLADHGAQISAAVPYGAYFKDSIITGSDWPATVPILHMHGTEDARVNPLTGEGEADLIYQFGILSDHMEAVAARNDTSLVSAPDFTSIELALNGAEVVVENHATSYVLLEDVAHYWPRELNGYGPDGSAAVLNFINQFGNEVEGGGYCETYKAWLQQHPLLSATNTHPEADPDEDRLPNLLEMMMGLDPISSELGSESYPTSSLESGVLKISFPIAPNLLEPENSEIEIYGETSRSLGSDWTRVEPKMGQAGMWEISVSTEEGPMKFLRLTATETEAQ